jgi:IMP dehydrogenase
MQKLMTFDDVLISPCFSTVGSRKEVDLSCRLGQNLGFKLPIISSNMDTVTGARMAHSMSKFSGFALLHRFFTIEENVAEFRRCPQESTGVSIGVGEKEFERAAALYEAGARVFCLDVAHAAQMVVVDQSRNIRQKFGSNVHIMVGTFANSRSINDWLHHGGEADSIHIGVGPGSACSTRIKTGVGIPQLSAIQDCVRSGLPVISNGGCRNPGDIAKAIAAGAKAVILGGMLAATEEAPGDVETTPKGQFKKYRGSASLESYAVQNKLADYRTAEGESMLLPYKGSVERVLQDVEGGLRSAFTYVGARNMDEFQRRAELVQITPSAMLENGPHGTSQALKK